MQPNLSKFTDLALFECGREKCIATKEITFTVKPYHLFHYVLFGKGFFVLDDQIYELKKGSIFYIPPHVQPTYYPNTKDPWTYTWIAFDGLIVDQLLSMCNLSRQNPIYQDSKDFKLYQYFINIAERYSIQGQLDIKTLGFVYELFSEMIALSDHSNQYALNPKDGHIKEAEEFVMYNYQFPISVKDIADSLNITSNYLANIFRERKGYSPKQYLIKYRINKACFLLNIGDYKINDIATKVGYINQFHFASEFKRLMKMTPTEYRHSILKSKEEIKI